jgi:NAD(P)-dependent dehydrogenase (short-subunit alcohol dehydrogenase family)
VASVTPRTWVEISREALGANTQLLQSLINEETTLCAVLKANAYGHGIELIGKILLESGRRHFAVDSLEEGMILRRLSAEAEIIVLGILPTDHLREAISAGLIVNVASVAGHVPSPYIATYAASKHGIVGFTRSLALECRLRRLPIRFCLVSPGFADTTIMKTNPKMMPPRLLVSQPTDVAKQIVSAVARGEAEIYPARIGGFSVLSYKYLPKIFESMSQILFSNTHRELMGWDSIQR